MNDCINFSGNKKQQKFENLKWVVVIPAYNEELTIGTMIKEIIPLKPTQLIVVNDCSSDNTANILDQYAITTIHNHNNSGKAASLWKGFEKAIEIGADIVITLDGDGQHAPKDIPKVFRFGGVLYSYYILIILIIERVCLFPANRFLQNSPTNLRYRTI